MLSLHSHSSGIGQMINEDEALKIILAKHSTDQNLSVSSNPPTEERTSEVSDLEGKSSDSDCTNQIEINYGNSLNKKSGWSFDEKEIVASISDDLIEGETSKADITIPETSKSMEHSYNALIESYNMLGASTIKTPILSDLMQKLDSISNINKKESLVFYLLILYFMFFNFIL